MDKTIHSQSLAIKAHLVFHPHDDINLDILRTEMIFKRTKLPIVENSIELILSLPSA